MFGAAAALVVLLQACFELGKVGPAAGPAEPPPRFAAPERLAPFFTALAALADGSARQPVRILQIGDSHSANDSLSGHLRELFQARFGDAGRGWLPAGVPYAYYRPHLVSVSETGWQHVKATDHSGQPLGLDAVAALSRPRDATMSLDSTDPNGFDRFAVEYVARPRGTPFAVQVDGGRPMRVSTAASTASIRRFSLKLDQPARRVELTAKGRPPVVLLGWDVERAAPGIIYENHGTIGATVNLLGQMSPSAVTFEMDDRRPALLIVAFGTNEGFDDGLDLEHYAARFAANVEALQRAAHGAPVLIVGPPDGNRVTAGCTATACDSGSTESCAWHEPVKLSAVRDIQRRAAEQHGWGFWDWFAAMGGTCSIDRMASAQPPLAAADHVHLTQAGYDQVADQLFADLMRDYERWKAQPHTS